MLITGHAKLWPREVFDIYEGTSIALGKLPELQKPGVYILYRDEDPYYIGKATKTVYRRLHDHSNKSTDEYFQFWNYCSFFTVSSAKYLAELEALLIASFPSSNRASPKIQKVKLPKVITDQLREVRKNKVKP